MYVIMMIGKNDRLTTIVDIVNRFIHNFVIKINHFERDIIYASYVANAIIILHF